ncbi:MAG: DUF2281 domain-containing protein [Polaromonas sp.]
MNTAALISETIKDFPDPVLTEVLDFAEFLRDKRLHPKLTPLEQPLIELSGGLENSVIFAEDALELQQRMRDEWN